MLTVTYTREVNPPHTILNSHPVTFNIAARTMNKMAIFHLQYYWDYIVTFKLLWHNFLYSNAAQGNASNKSESKKANLRSKAVY